MTKRQAPLLNKRLFYLAVAMMSVVVAVIYLSKQTAVVMSAPDVHCRLPSVFRLMWRHSIEKQHWQEVYQLDGQVLVLSKTYVQTFGAGVPTSGQPVLAPTGYVGQSVWQVMPQINWLISRNMQGQIIFDDSLPSHSTPWRLYERLPDYVEVQIKAVPLNAWQRWRIPSCQVLAWQDDDR